MTDGRDPHLLTALQHAPDRDALPPAALSGTILASAQAALRAQRPSRWREAWQRMQAAMLRPSVAAAFGSLAVATAVGLLWSTQEPPEATPSLRVDATPSPSSAAPAAVGSPPVVADAAPRDAAASGANRTAQRTGSPSTPSSAQRAATPAAAQAAAPITTMTTAPAPATTPAPPAVARRRETRNADAGLAVALPAAPSATAAPATPAASASPPPPPSAVTAVRESMQDAAAPTSSAALAGRASARSDLARSAAPAAPDALAKAEAVDPLAAASRRLDAPGSQTLWQTPARSHVHDADTRAWWAAVRRASAGAWQRTTDAPVGDSVALAIDGQPLGRLTLSDAALTWRAADGTLWRADVPPAAARELRDVLARW